MSTYFDTSGVPSEGAARHAVIGVASAAEAYVDSVLAHLMAEFAEQSGPPGRALVKNAQKDIDRSWAQRARWLSSFLPVTLANEETWNRLQTLIDLRNAIAHGTGGLSPDQTSSGRDGYIKAFRKVFDCQYAEMRIIVPPRAVETAIVIGRRSVLWIDQKAAEQSGTVRNVALR
jgi:hypothetical protein